MKRSTLLLALVPLLLGAARAQAGNLVDLQLVDRDTGSTLPLYWNNGKAYTPGVPGHRYSVRITNHTNARVLTVLSVDGVNAITGETARADESGYVLAPYESTEIEGWRNNMSEIAAFEFTALSDSYAARTGRPNNVGVIGVAVYRERYRPPQPVYREDEIARADSRDRAGLGARAGASADAAARPAPPATAQATAPSGAAPADARRAEKALAEESLGTGHGQRESSQASYTSFERESTRPYEVVSVWYDSYANLQARGIVPRVRPPRPSEPQAFPAGFVADPPARW